jgi:hypothetical protein
MLYELLCKVLEKLTHRTELTRLYNELSYRNDKIKELEEGLAIQEHQIANYAMVLKLQRDTIEHSKFMQNKIYSLERQLTTYRSEIEVQNKRIKLLSQQQTD